MRISWWNGPFLSFRSAVSAVWISVELEWMELDGASELQNNMVDKLRWLKTPFSLARGWFKLISVKKMEFPLTDLMTDWTELNELIPKFVFYFFLFQLQNAAEDSMLLLQQLGGSEYRWSFLHLSPSPTPSSPPAFQLCRRVGWEKFRASILRRKLPAKPWQKRVKSITTLASKAQQYKEKKKYVK